VTRTQIAARTIVALLLTAGGIYGGDYLVLRIRMTRATVTTPFESMTRTRVLAIPQKSGKFDYQVDQLQPQETLTCVHALFPHYGDQPCWYLKPRFNQPIPVS